MDDARKTKAQLIAELDALRQRLTDTEERVRQLSRAVEQSPVSIVITDLRGNITYVNPKFTQVTGYTLEEALGQNPRILKSGYTSPEGYAELWQTISSGQTWRGELHNKRKNGELYWEYASISPITDDHGQVTHYIAVKEDITDLKRAEESLRDSERQARDRAAELQTIMDTVPATVWLAHDQSGQTITGNRAAYERYRLSPGSNASLNAPDDQRPIHFKICQNGVELPPTDLPVQVAAATGVEILDFEEEIVFDDGTVIYELGNVKPLFDDAGQPRGAVAVFVDVTDHRAAEQAIQRERLFLRTLIDNLPDLIYVKDSAARKILTNRSDVQFTGRTTEAELLGKTDLEVFPGEIGRRGFVDDLAVLESGQPVFNREEDFLDAQGGQHWLSTSKIPLRDENGQLTGLVGIGHDITERKRAEETLQWFYQEVGREKEYFESLVRNNPVATVVVSPSNEVVSWNPAAEQLFDYAPEEAIGHNINELITTSESRAEAEEFSRQTMTTNGRVHTITRRARKDGTLVDVELLGVPIVVDDVQIGALAIYHDITELQRAREEAEAATQAKSAFLAMMSHEIRTPMNGVIGMTSLLLDTELTHEQQDYAETIRASGEALLTIINDILDFSKIEAGRMELETQPFDVRECVESALDLVASKAREKRLELAYFIDAPTPPTVLGDVTRLRQILINLLGNALKFTDKGEVIVLVNVESGPRTEGAPYALHFAVKDTGLGIPPDRMDRLFRSFSQVDASTTRKYGGTGLGLAISKRLSELMGGTMWVESEGVPGRGSTFHFTIRAAAAPAQVHTYLRAEQAQLRDRRVLIVDDNDTNRRVLVGQTRAWNMIPFETPSPREALTWIQRGDPFDVALLDMQMPEMDGLMLAQKIRDQRDVQSLPLIMLSSLGRTEVGAERSQFAAYLIKPIKQSMLYDALVQVFAGQPEAVHERAATSQFDAQLAERLPLRLLLAEDNAVNQKLALQMLRKMGYRADVAGNGLEVLDALERQPYDVILMDVQMPELDGLETARRIRAIRQTGFYQPRIIAMTANAMQGDREACLAAGMDDYVSKPIQVKELQSALERWGQRPPTLALAGSARVEPAATPAAEPAAEIDWAMLNDLRALQTEGEPDFAQEMIDLYLENAPQLIATMKQALAENQPANLQRAAHTLKGSSASLGVQGLSAMALELEKMGREDSLAEAPARISELEQEFDRVRLAFHSPSTLH